MMKTTIIPKWKKFLLYVEQWNKRYGYSILPSRMIKDGVIASRKELYNLLYSLKKKGYINWLSYPTCSNQNSYDIKITFTGYDAIADVLNNQPKENAGNIEIDLNGETIFSMSNDEFLTCIKQLNDIIKKFASAISRTN